MAKVKRYEARVVVGLLISIMAASQAFTQTEHRLVVRYVDTPSVAIANSLQLRSAFTSAQQCAAYVAQLPKQLRQKGFIAAAIDTVLQQPTVTTIDLYLGNRFGTLQLRVNDGDKPYLQSAGIDIGRRPFLETGFDAYQTLTNKLLDYFENNGYPFAAVNLDSITLFPDYATGSLVIDKGFEYKIDSIRQRGPARLSKNFLNHYLAIEPRAPYNRARLDKINQRLQELPYVEQYQAWDISMLNTGSTVNLYLKPKKSNQVDIIAGFLPANQQLGGKLLLTVDANLQLKNAFSSGETVGLVWQQIQPGSPRLHLNYTQPYIFNSPLGVDLLFDLFKRDSSFLNVNGQLGLLYMKSVNATGKVTLQTQRTNVLTIDTLAVKVSRRLPDVADVSSFSLGFSYDLNTTNYRFNPQTGSELSFDIGAGSKTIRKNSAITLLKDGGFDYSSLYDSVRLKAYQVRAQVRAARYFKTGKQSVVKTAVNAGWFQSPNYFRNELFQIGGYRLLRGFDEESIYTNQYAVATIEYRYLIGLNSNLFIFSDGGFTNNKVINQSYSYIGAGVGLSFETKGGIFNLSYAAGKRNDLDFSMKQAKIHIGYVSLF